LPLEGRLATSLALAVAVVYWATPVAIRVAGRLNFYDKPAGYKGHAKPTPYLGGAAVMAGFLLAAAIWSSDWSKTLPVLVGVAVLWAVGTLDDRRTVPWWARVGIEVSLALTLFALGHGWSLGQGAALDLVLTVVWVVAVVNAFNLFDNMDGAASSMGLVVAGGIAVLGVVQGDTWLALTAVALCGACLGFLPHNLTSPARIFLGDGGSMPLGFAIAALTMIGASEAVPEWQALAAGLLLVGVPALDTCLVVVSRTGRGISILTGGRDHLTHRSRRRLRTARAVAIALGAVQAVLSSLALIAVEGGSEALVLAVLVYLVGVGTAVALLDRRAHELEDAAPTATPDDRRVPPESWVLLTIALLLAVSPLFAGYYDSRIWVPGGLALLFVAAAGAIARPLRPSGPALLAVGGLIGLAVLSLLSSAWGDSIEQAIVEGNRLAVYAALVVAVLVLARSQKGGMWLLAGLAVGTLAVAGVVVARMLGSDPSDVFLGGRLDQPLGYINGEASLFVIGFWLWLALAEQRARPWLAGPALGVAALMASLALLSQSRGAAVAMGAGLLVVFAVAPGRLRRSLAVLAVGVAVVIAGPTLLDVFRTAQSGDLPDGVVRDAAWAALATLLSVGLVWSAASELARRLSAGQRLGARRGVAGALAVLTLLGAGVGVASAGRIADTARTQYNAFVRLGEVEGSGLGGETTSRLVSGAGNRYDYWRVAWNSWRERPIRGVGAGNYDAPYFAGRTTTEDIRQPHSIELQVLSELGLAGGVLLVMLVGGLGWGLWRGRPAARESDPGRVALVAGAGATAAWLAHSTVDWIHLLPGVTGVALAAGALALRAPEPTSANSKPRRLPPVAASASVALLAGVFVFAALSLGRQGLAEYFRDEARSNLAQRPAEALADADRSLRLDPEAMTPYYVKAAALARFNEADAAEAVLRQAAAREPLDFVTWALLGDLAVRRGRLDDAKRHYGRSSGLNPRDRGLAALTSDPRPAPTATPVP